MTATDELRRMLDERGVEWWETVVYIGMTITNEGIGERHYLVSTFWNSLVFGKVEATDMGDGVLHMACLNGRDFTPEQAIEATLGRGTCKARLYKPEHGSSDCTICECGEINDISANYCNRCGRQIKVVDE